MNDQLLLVCRAVMTIVFAASVLGKVRSPGAFAAAVRVMRVVPARLAGPVAAAVPVLEAGLALAVWVPVLTAWAFGAAAVTLVAFTAALVAVLRRGIDASCSCFGISAAPVGPAQVVRNCVLLAFSSTGLATALAADGGAVPADHGKILLGILVAAPLSILLIFSEVLHEVFGRSTVK
ncbi:hypothetical protein Kpho02_08820 [Kitasatospora phosalacinea]|uniref:Methylamine utilisation protein MauE domain-containing protein n=1 Tax=Kitasatospora phosalacinea TaxID=2065 RepID=A0A9W6UZT8_9ACTN|nr:MauE/DoxX family redox-associated membrane protein [Kitasatospora phosalacinea]GLW68583.1 hypothetical protein Kpho02_08820 [Kitasatospora phosalacinea]